IGTSCLIIFNKSIFLSYLSLSFLFFAFLCRSLIISSSHSSYGFGPAKSIFVSGSYLTYFMIRSSNIVSLIVSISSEQYFDKSKALISSLNRIILKKPLAFKDKSLSVRYFIIDLYIKYLFIISPSFLWMDDLETQKNLSFDRFIYQTR